MSVAPSDSISNVASGPPASTTLTVPTQAASGGKRRGKKKNSSGPPRVPASSVSGVPTPRHLSTTATPTRDDPMLIDEFLVSGADSMAPVTVRPTVLFDGAGLVTLTERVYADICVNERHFSQLVPLPLFQWYVTVAYWYRHIFLSVAYGRSEVDNVVVLERYRSITWMLPAPIKRYLDGIGEFRTPFGDLFRPAAPYWPSNNCGPLSGYKGSFDQVSADTAYKYISHPSPWVAVYNVCAAIARSTNTGNWSGDLPQALRPAPVEGHTWSLTPNLLGFDPNITLTSKQVSNLRNLTFVATATGQTNFSSVDRFCFWGPAVTYVSEAIGALKTYKVDAFTNSSIVGTLSAGPFLGRTSDVPFGSRYVDWQFEVDSSFQAESRISSAALLMAYRVNRTVNDDGVPAFLPYRYHKVGEEPDLVPPGNYLANGNRMFHFGSANRLNNDWFVTGAVERLDVLAEMTRSFVKH